MAKNEVFRDADHITLPVVASVVSGEPVKVGSLTGVAETDRDTAGNATVALKGAYTLTAAAATYAVGDPIYGHATGGGAVTARVELVDKTSTTGTLLGHSLEAKTLAAAGSLIVRLV
jgi:predicted RecA/RadA family phage recombinase